MVQTLNIKAGLPTAEDAVGRMRTALALARRNGIEMVRLVHGYGSTGVGGTLCTECRACLERLVANGRILRYVRGDDYTLDRAAILGWLQRYPELRKTLPSDSNNPGITFIVLFEKSPQSSSSQSSGGFQPLKKKDYQRLEAIATLEFAPIASPKRATQKGNPASPRTTPPQKRKTFTKTGKDFDVLQTISRRPSR